MSAHFFPRDEYFKRLALREAERARDHDDVPVGCGVAHEGEVLASAPNERELRGDPTAHAEVLALREAARRLGSWRLSGTVLYVTLEPCAMCAGAIVLVHPFDERPGLERYSEPAPLGFGEYRTFCGT